MTFNKYDFSHFQAVQEKKELILTPSHMVVIEELISELMANFDSIESSECALSCEIASAHLPTDLLAVLKVIAAGEKPFSYLVIRGFPVDDQIICPSPSHWDQRWDKQPYLREEIFQLLLSSAVGGVFGWRTQENGRFLRHIVPIQVDAMEQLGGGSKTTLEWHTEEAFHPGRADFFTLMCYRNRELATTNISSVDDLNLSEEILEVLRSPRFIIMPDKSHLPIQNNSTNWNLNKDAFVRIQYMLDNPEPVAILCGRKNLPQMRIDQAFVVPVSGDEQAAEALRVLHAELSRNMAQLKMLPGDLVLLDNLRVAHGRSIYAPNYGPHQRWMRRVNIWNGRRIFDDFRDPERPRVML